MIDLAEELFAITALFEKEGVPYAVCGALAVAIHGYPRATKDIDVLIQEADVARAEELVAQCGFTIPAGIIPFAVGTPQERRVFRVSKIRETEVFTLDLVIVTPILQEVWDGRVRLELEDRLLNAVSKEGLIHMKRLANRPQDQLDISRLDGHL